MDESNRQLQDARRARALRDQARVEAEAVARMAPDRPVETELSAPSRSGRLVLERHRGEWSYILGEVRLRAGDPTEFLGEMVVSLPDDTICRWPG